MNEELVKFIELCLADGVISEKERKVIFRKAELLNVDKDECEILIDSYTQNLKKELKAIKSSSIRAKRNFTKKKVYSIKPAALNNEKKLQKEASVLEEKDLVLFNNYKAEIEKLKKNNKQIIALKKQLKIDYDKDKKETDATRKKLYINLIGKINNDISKKYGKTQLILSAGERNKIFKYNLNAFKEHIIKNGKWSGARYNEFSNYALGVLIFLCVACLAFIFLLDDYYFIDEDNDSNYGIPFFGISIAISHGIYKHYKNKTELNFTDQNVKASVNSMSNKLKKSFDELEANFKIMNEYEYLKSYSLTVPKLVRKRKDIARIINLLKSKNSHGY